VPGLGDVGHTYDCVCGPFPVNLPYFSGLRSRSHFWLRPWGRSQSTISARGQESFCFLQVSPSISPWAPPTLHAAHTFPFSLCDFPSCFHIVIVTFGTDCHISTFIPGLSTSGKSPLQWSEMLKNSLEFQVVIFNSLYQNRKKKKDPCTIRSCSV
jgi:hypothetical protein